MIESKYSPLDKAAFFMMQRRQREIRGILENSLAERLEYDLSTVKLLEVGCGNAQWLTEFQMFGLRSANLAGIELSAERAESAETRMPEADIRSGDAAALPWPNESFDIVFQSTVFTSILDLEKRAKVAEEMKRVCKKDGFILWYDFAFDSPSNPNVKGVPKCEIRGLFAPWLCEIKKVTLAPPIARRIVPFCWILAEKLETFFPFLRTHLIAKIVPELSVAPAQESDV
ncbi:MAG: class I SAM-dependent methyltransferase [Victivallales bacterium]|nr:class I SAM-dependent methyltransferase [Victivallales bacterium]